MVFPEKRKPSNRLKKILSKKTESIIYSDSEEEMSSSKSYEMIGIRKRNQSRRLKKMQKKLDNGNEEEFQINQGEEILQKVFENNIPQRESKIRTRRRIAFENKKNL